MYCHIEVDKEDMKKIMSKLRGAKKDVPKHLRNAINRVVTQTMKQIREGRKEAYTITASRFNQAITVQRATVNHLDATIKSAARPPTIRNFKISASKRYGVRADVNRTGLKMLEAPGAYGKAFIPTSGKLAGLVTQRRIGAGNGGRFRVPYGPSVPKMIEMIWQGKRGGQGNMQQDMRERLHDEIRAEIAKII